MTASRVRPSIFLLACVTGLVGWLSLPARVQVDEPFRGVTTNGTVRTGLFPIRATGVSTADVKRAAQTFLASLSESERAATQFPVDDDEWRLWNNVHRYARQGVGFEDMNERQREAAFGLLRASLSAEGFEKSRNIMRLNYHLAELISNFEAYGEWLYWITIMGEPSDTEPWGWQLDGHHLVINYFVLGDQVVMTPTFMGSEPVVAQSGKYAGTNVLQEEQEKGLSFMRSLAPDQRRTATIETSKTGRNALAQAFRDNLVLDYAGLPANQMNDRQRALLLDVIREYVDDMDQGHAAVKMAEVETYLDDTYFAWVGGTEAESVFYYRIQSPVILIEFDHQPPVALEGQQPTRQHIHSVLRTPNGNDYGTDLLRQHYEAHAHDATHGHDPGSSR